MPRTVSPKNIDYCRTCSYNKIMENNELSQYMTAIADPSNRLTAERLTMMCGVRADLKGSKRLVDAIILYGTDLCSESCEIYRIIGAIRKIKFKTVMREISYAITQAFDIATRLSNLVGIKFTDNDIHNGLVIAYLGKIFKHPDLAVYA